MGKDSTVLSQERASRLRKAQERDTEGAKARAEYEAHGLAVEANTVRLKAIRLKKEQADRDAVAPAPAVEPDPPKKPRKKRAASQGKA